MKQILIVHRQKILLIFCLKKNCNIFSVDAEKYANILSKGYLECIYNNNIQNMINYLNNLDIIKKSAVKNGIRSGIHVVSPEVNQLKTAINEGYEFIAYSTDALLLYERCANDLKNISTLRNK